MSDSVQMPALGESVTEGTVTRWLKSVGDTVELDEPLLEVATDKVDTEIPSPFAGTLTEILVQEDETVDVGTPLATIGAEGASAEPAEAAPAEEPAAQEQPAEAAESAESTGATEFEGSFEVASAPEDAAPAEADPAPAAPAEAPAPTGGGGGQDVTMPALGESVTEGTVTRWLKAVGESVEVDEPLLEVATDKVDTEIPSPFAGTLSEILVQEDETVDVGTVLARLGGEGAGAQEAPAQQAEPKTEPKAAPAPEPKPEPQAEPKAEPKAEPTARPSAGTGGSYLTPLVRQLAEKHDVDLSDVTGTGVGGRIRKEDVLEAAAQAEAARKAASAPAAPAPAAAPAAPQAVEVSPLRGTTEKASRLRQVIATRMVEALHSMAQLTTVVEVDVTRVAALRATAKDDFRAREGVNLSYLPFFVLAATEALKEHPKINGVLQDNQITYHGQENVGIAVDTDRGLVVPVIRDAGDLNLAGIARKIVDLAARTRDNKVTPDELSGATFTVTNTGWGGALFDTPIVPGGTSAILGTGTIAKRPVVATDEFGNDFIAIRSMCYLALSYDHRLVDGADASRYLQTVKKRIEEGAFEGELGR